MGFRKDPYWVLHCLSYILMIMCNVSSLMKSIVLADDTNLFYSGENLSQVCENVSTELENFIDGFKSISFH